MRQGLRHPVVYALMTAVLFGSGAPLAKTLLQSSSPIVLSALLYFGSGVGLSLYLLITTLIGKQRAGREASLTKNDIPWLSGVILFGGFLAPLTFMISLQYTHAATASLLLNFEAVATTIIAVVLFHEEVGRRVWLALLLITTACILLALNPLAFFRFSIPAIGILATCFFWSLDNNVARNIAAKDPLIIITIKGLCGGSLSLLTALFLKETLPSIYTIEAGLMLGFISYGGLTSVLFLLALRGIGTARSASFLAISPIFGVPIALLLFTDLPSSSFFLAAPIMALGVWLLITEHHSHPHHHDDEVHEHRHRHDDLHHEHSHSPDMPPLLSSGDHSHPHHHKELTHDHPHRPDIHHRHTHER